ncbi:MAG: DNA repair protein RecO [Thermoflexales bacterium]|nr:DNA repair protein RecO [Thermoflexales bacterium]MDW8351272.1 DNA repair protein RecO [Anaerolineae bacterium]
MHRMRAYATEAIVVRREDYGEADRLVTLLTPDYGKLRALAKGARKPTSRKAGHIELFARTRLLLAKGRTFDLITQAELIEAHRLLREEIGRGALAHYLCELAYRFAPEGSDAAPLYDLLAEGLDRLCESADPQLVARYFELRLLTLEGYRPELFRCARTQLPLANDVGDAPVAFSPSQGGVLCEEAASSARDVFRLSRGGLALLRTLQTQPFEIVQMLDVAPELHEHIARALQLYIGAILERRPRTAAFLDRLAREMR